MKHLYTLTVALVLGTGLCAQIPNAGFEDWTAMGSYDLPNGWGNLNAVTDAMGEYTCAKGTPGSPGASYLELTSRTVSGMGVVPAIAVSGAIDAGTFEPTSGFPFAERPASMTGKWQYMASGNDQGYISINLTRWNTLTATREPIAYAVRHLTGMAMSWANFTINLTYTSGEVPDTAVIVLSASGNSPVNYSYLYVDNLAFNGTVTGVEEHDALVPLHIFPNPAVKEFTVQFDLAVTGKALLQVLDATGRTAIERPLFPPSAGQRLALSTAGLSPGSYVVRCLDTSETFSQRLMIQ